MVFLVFGWYIGHSQSLPAIWKGTLTQTGGQDTFLYELQLEWQGQEVSGNAFSENPKGGKAQFSVRGSWDGRLMLLQELKQEMPAQPKWCLKYLKLELATDGRGNQHFKGDWQAEGCRPGSLVLFPVGKIGSAALPVSGRLGRWTGHLDQEDREYGFFYEIILEANGKGRSHIVSEASGGTATHQLDWQWDSSRQVITIIEKKVLEKTDPDWPWCIKQAELSLLREPRRQVLTGDWSGFIEGFTKKDGACASGKMYLEKPILEQQAQREMVDQSVVYEKEHGRKAKVDRVIQVSSPKIRVRIWDNGTVDGDIVTIFLNGEKLVSKFRVNKHKWSIPVTLPGKENLLIIHSEDLGAITPNTVAVSIDDGKKEQILVISSDLRVSGGILIQPFEYSGE